MAKSSLHRYTEQEALNILTGGGGADIVAASGSDVNLTAHTYVAVPAITECDVDLVSSDTDVWDSHTGLVIPAGTTVYGNWSSVNITDGDTAVVYRAHSTD